LFFNFILAELGLPLVKKKQKTKVVLNLRQYHILLHLCMSGRFHWLQWDQPCMD